MFGCARKAIYELRGVPHSDPRTARSRRILFVGSRWHEIVQAAVEGADLDEVYTEVRIDIPELNITGHADQLVRRGDHWEMEEYKSISSRGFTFLKGAPKPEHVEQAMIYLWALRTKGTYVNDDEAHGRVFRNENETLRREAGQPAIDRFIPPLGDALDRIRFVYISKDDLRTDEFIVHWEPEMEQRIRERVAQLDTFRFDDAALPERLPLEKGGRKNWLCRDYCEFRTKCWDVDGEGTAVASGQQEANL